MFGSFEIVGPEGVVRCNLSHKARLLFAYLASQPHKRITKEALTETFWGDCPASRGPNNLSIAVYQIRSWLREVGEKQSNAISVQHGSYSFGADGWSIDAVEFSRYVTQARGAAARGNTDTVRALMRTAADLYRGDFLAEDAYEDWTAGPRRAYAQEFIGVLRWLMEDAARASDWTTVETQSARATAMDDCDEAAHRWLMVAHWKLGDRAKALFLYRRLRERLKLELGVTPSKQTQEVFRLISD
jgi:DNA-binding SARP family transcriptional activator